MYRLSSSTQPSRGLGCLLVGGVTTGSSHRVRLVVRADCERQLPSGCLLQLAICCAVSWPSPHEQTGVITSGTRHSNKKARSPIFPVLIWTRIICLIVLISRSYPPFDTRQRLPLLPLILSYSVSAFSHTMLQL